MADQTLYVTADAAPYVPATFRGAWDDTTTDGRHALATGKSGSIAYDQFVPIPTGANYDTLLYRASYILPAAIVFAGNLSGCLGCRESYSGVNAYLHVHAFVTKGQSDEVRGTLVSDAIDAEEWATSTSACGEAFSAAMSNVEAQAGDVLVLELGCRTDASSASYSARIYYGGTSATALADGGNGSTLTGWITYGYTLPAGRKGPAPRLVVPKVAPFNFGSTQGVW